MLVKAPESRPITVPRYSGEVSITHTVNCAFFDKIASTVRQYDEHCELAMPASCPPSSGPRRHLRFQLNLRDTRFAAARLVLVKSKLEMSARV